ncbi:MAG: TIGR04255 family protein [Acetobacteraceae bacterium]|nr:TIGR04255 family protein [Acetobacteraceae bacterium]
MSGRSTDLPDFGSPPVTEVAVGVQFNSLNAFLAPHLGGVWDLFRGEFDIVEEHVPLPPMFETFGQNPQLAPPVPFQILTSPGSPRIFFVNSDRSRLIQVQRDRFVHNWRKIGTDDTYPRFEGILATFRDGYERFARHLGEVGIGPIEPTQCEVTYINQIIIPPEMSSFELSDQMFGGLIAKSSIPGLGRPEDGRFLLRYVIRGIDDEPLGRLIVSSEPAWRADGSHIIQFVLTARGAPKTPRLDSVLEFLGRGRECIVHGFKALTSELMHEKWELKR